MATQNSQNTFDPFVPAAEEAKARETFFSFGDEGLTASVGAYGRLLRITKHFPGHKTGFCVEPSHMPEPYYTTERMEWFLVLAQYRGQFDYYHSIGPCLDSLCSYPEAAPQHKIIDDRWPTFTQSSEDFTLHVEYVASAGTIYQKFEFQYTDGRKEDEELPEDKVLDLLSLQPDLLIRDLDFVDKNNNFNKASAMDGNTYETQFSDTDRSHIIRKHNMGDGDLCLHINILSKSRSVELFEPDRLTVADKHGRSIEPDRESSFGLRRRRGSDGSKLEDGDDGTVFRFVLAYTLDYVSTSCICPPTWTTFCEADKLLRPRRDETAGLSDENNLSTNLTLNFFLKRNLEYILSVCSVPIPETAIDGIPAIALTCGDVEGHRVNTAASFYAFQFLLIALKRFMDLHSAQSPTKCSCDAISRSSSTTSTTSYICTMKDRVERVCKGHIKWVFLTTRGSDGISCPNYWANGEEIHGWESNKWLPKRSLVDAPFQLIKVGDLHQLLKTLPQESLRAANDSFNTWIKELKIIDKLDFSAFPSYNDRAAQTGTETFYFTDHALIWRAVKSGESMQFKLETLRDERQKYSADALRKNVIKRFTTEHPVLKKRMIATKRTRTRTQFLLRSKDTFLFRAMEEKLFDKVNLWSNTMDCQQYHEGNDDAKWEDPRRFILSIAMARHNTRINLRSRKEMLQHAISTLLRTASANGLFAGRLDGSLSPVMYDSERTRDDYWAVVFEVPYLLWKFYCSGQINDEIAIDSKVGPESINDRLDSIGSSVDNITRLLGDVVVQQAHSAGQQSRSGYWMKRDLPFNNIIAEENIVDVHDEWLYNRPSFFAEFKEKNVVSSPDRTLSNVAIQAAAENHNKSPYTGFIVDVPDRKSWKKEEAMNDSQLRCFKAPTRVTAMLGEGRTVEHAKKRFWAFVSQSPSSNASCIETVPAEEVREKRELDRFLCGHESYDNFFTEQTEPQLNLWTTEFHISFGHPAANVAMGFRFEGDFFDRYWTCRYVEADQQGSSGKRIVEDMIKQLLDPGDLIMKWNNGDETSTPSKRGDWAEKLLRVGPWRQRRVLELRLFRRIIKRMIDYAENALESAKGEVEDQKDKLQMRLDSERLDRQRQEASWWPSRAKRDSETVPIDYRSFLAFIRQLQDIQTKLQAVGADFAESKAKINLWLGREDDRRAERPRWTFNDESRYGIIISKLLVKNNRSIQALERNHTMITNLSESITKDLERVRNHLEIMHSDKEQRRAEEMTLFTYVTAIFLPLGFATGLYSMSGMPDGKTAGAMVGTFFGVLLFVALIFLAVTQRGPFRNPPGSPTHTPPSLPSVKGGNDNGSASEGEKVPGARNAFGAANRTGLRSSCPAAAAGIVGSLIRRRKNEDVEATGDAVNPTVSEGEAIGT